MCGVYQIRNILNNKIYIGSSKNIEARWKKHLTSLKGGYHHSQALQRSYNLHGKENFSFEVLEECPEEILLEREQYYIDTLNPIAPNGYNVSNKAQNCVLFGEQNGMYGKYGENNPNFGRKNTEETKIKMSQAQTRKTVKQSTKEKIRDIALLRAKEHPESFVGGWQYISEENKIKISQIRSIPVCQIDKNSGEFIKIFQSALEAQKETGIDNGTIGKVCKHCIHSNTAGGYKWYFADEYMGMLKS